MEKFSIPLPNVPLIHLSQSFIKNHQSYLIDAFYISSRNSIMHSRHVPCSIENNQYRKDETPINLKRIKQMIFGNQIRLNRKCPCKKQHIVIHHQPQKTQSKLYRIPQKPIRRKIHPPILSISSEHIISIPSLIPPSRILTSNTRFGKSMLALYFQKYRFKSPKIEILQLLKSRKKNVFE